MKSGRGEGEAAVVGAFPQTTLIRPAVMFGPGDAFVTPLVKMLRILPAIPLFGRGQTKLQPSFVEDVGAAVAQVLRTPAAAVLYELGGPHIYTYKALLQALEKCVRRHPPLFPVPFIVWRVLGQIAEVLPHPPITKNQVDLMRIDNVATASVPGFEDVDISPQSVENVVPRILRTLI